MSRRGLIHIDRESLGTRITRDHTILDILTNASITVTGHQNLKSILIVCRTHFQRLIDKPSVGRCVKHLHVFRNNSGNVGDEFHLRTRGDFLVSRLHGFDNRSSCHAGFGQSQRPQQANRLRAEDCIQTSDKSHDQQRGAQANQQMTVNGFVDMNLGQFDGRSFFQSPLNRRIIFSPAGLQIDKGQEAAFQSLRRSVQHPCCIQRVNGPKPRPQDVPKKYAPADR